jgi:hypothetical protein
MDFLFSSDSEMDRSNLRQGDLLLKDSSLADVLRPAHSYYADAPDYSHFMVLTQSCDLVRRSRLPKATYITLAAVRPFTGLLEKQLVAYRFRDLGLVVEVCDRSKGLLAQQFLERMLHNTEPGFFFFRKDSHQALSEDLCVFLTLSVALRVDHYEECLRSKIAQLQDIFAAKVGWSVGNLYSRVGTPDIEEKLPDAKRYKESFFSDSLESRAIWLSAAQFRRFDKALNSWKRDNPGATPSLEAIRKIVERLETDMELISDRALNALSEAGLFNPDSDVRNRASNVLTNDTALQRLIRTSSV